MTQDADKRHKLMAHMDRKKAQANEPVAWRSPDPAHPGWWFYYEPQVKRPAEAIPLYATSYEAEAVEEGALMALATVIGERDAALAEAERLRTRAREISAHADKMERERDDALAENTTLRKRVTELEKSLNAARTAQIARGDVFSDANPEARWIEDSKNACPNCGGSGHKDDALTPPPDAELDALATELDKAWFRGTDYEKEWLANINTRLFARVSDALRARKGGAA